MYRLLAVLNKLDTVIYFHLFLSEQIFHQEETTRPHPQQNALAGWTTVKTFHYKQISPLQNNT
jgi:hypothetical protein